MTYGYIFNYPFIYITITNQTQFLKTYFNPNIPFYILTINHKSPKAIQFVENAKLSDTAKNML